MLKEIRKITHTQSLERFAFDLQRFEVSFPDNLQVENGYYIITTEAQLQQLANYVNEGHDCSNMKFKLTKDLDLSKLKDADGNQINWTPIGKISNRFKGEFDGDGHTISHLSISSSSYYQGLFGYIEDAAISNINLTGVDITGYDKVGAVVGKVESGTVSNCSVQGNITATSYAAYVGGVVGWNTSTGTVKNSGFLGGSLVGSGDNPKLNAIAFNASTGTFTDNYYYGTLANGVNDNGATQVYKVTLPEGKDVTSESFVAKVGNAGYLKSGTAKFNYNDKTYTAEITADATITIDDDGFKIGDTVIEADQIDDKGYYLITNETQLQALANYVNAGHDCSGKKFKLTADLDLSTLDGDWTPIGNSSHNFKGEFDGDGHTISHLSINGDDWDQGLFGVIDGEVTISNINLTDVDITGYDNVGAVVGYVLSGTVSNCSVQGSITATASSNAYVGGVVGYNNNGTVDGCYFLGGTVKGTDYVGGVVGWNSSGTVKNSGFLGGSLVGSGDNPKLNAITTTGGTFGKNYYYGTLADGEDDNGAVNVIKITLPANVTVTTTTEDKFSTCFDGAAYVEKNTNVTFNIDLEAAGFEKLKSFKVDNEEFDINETLNVGTDDIEDLKVEGYPIIEGLEFDSTDNSYLIETKDNLMILRNQCIAATNDGKDFGAGLTFKLTNDISGVDFTINTNYSFAGTFDGNNHKITVNYTSTTESGGHCSKTYATRRLKISRLTAQLQLLRKMRRVSLLDLTARAQSKIVAVRLRLKAMLKATALTAVWSEL